jgi:predicted aconitase
VNSVVGARTNREGAPSALAAALTGRTPAYGFHLDENRHGDLKVIVDTKLEGTWDFGTLGYFAGKRAGIRTPVYTGMPKDISWDQFKILGAAAANSGGCAMYHAVGVTPEAPTEEAAFGNKNPKDVETYMFGEKELRETEEFLDKSKVREVDIVVLGCPNASLEEIKVAASLLDGKRLNSGAQLWVFTNQVMKAEADKAGFTQIIEASGGKIVVGSCTATMPQNLLKDRGFKGAATNSAKMVFFLQGQQGLSSHYGSTTRCVQAAISGIWS